VKQIGIGDKFLYVVVIPEKKIKKIDSFLPEEPEPSRLERLQSDVAELEARTEGEVRTALASARGRIEAYRAGEEVEEVTEDAR